MVNTRMEKFLFSFRIISLLEAFKKKKEARVRRKRGKKEEKERKKKQQKIRRERRVYVWNKRSFTVRARFFLVHMCSHVCICCSSSPFPHTYDSSVRSLNSQVSLFLFSSFPDPLPSRHLVFPLFSSALAVHSASLRVESVRVSSRVEYRVSSSSLCATERGTHRASRGKILRITCTFEPQFIRLLWGDIHFFFGNF